MVVQNHATRAGRYIRQPQGYVAFIPAPLPPEPPIEVNGGMLALLSRADQALGRLDGVAQTLPNPDLFVAMYVRREAVFSSQIEGTQSTLDDVLEFELDSRGRSIPSDVNEVVNYGKAMNHGLARLPTLPLSLRLIREIHGELLQGIRGGDRPTGEFRAAQNWMGEGHLPLDAATFVPPPPGEMLAALDNLEKFMYADLDLPVLLRCGLVHGQFETIHPFIDGNGRVGMLLITFLLCHRSVLHRPLLYLSYFLKRHRGEYYDRLQSIRESGDWEGWLTFFLRGVAETAEAATDTAKAIIRLRDQHRAQLQEAGITLTGLRLLDLLFEQPILNVRLAKDRLRVSFPTADALIDRLRDMGLLEETTGWQRNRRYRYTPYLNLFEEERGAEVVMGPVQTTVLTS